MPIGALRIATAAVSLLLMGSPEAADRLLTLKQGDPGGEQAFIDGLVAEARAGGTPDLAIDDLHIARLDLNDDGSDELFIVYDHPAFCGSAGCYNPIFERRDGRWAGLTGLDGGIVTRHRQEISWHLTIADVPRKAYRTILGAEVGARWRPSSRGATGEYRLFCMSERCTEMEGFAPVRKNPTYALEGRAIWPLGRHQLGKGAQIEVGLRGRNGAWNPANRYGVASEGEFFDDPPAQERAFADYADILEARLRAGTAARGLGRTIAFEDWSFTVILSGQIAAAHRFGTATVVDCLDFVRSQGWRSRYADVPAHKRAAFRAIDERLRLEDIARRR